MATDKHNNDGSWKADDINYMEERIQTLLEYLSVERNKTFMLQEQVVHLQQKIIKLQNEQNNKSNDNGFNN